MDNEIWARLYGPRKVSMNKTEQAKKRIAGPGARGNGPDVWAFITANYAKDITPAAFWLCENFYKDGLTYILEVIAFMRQVIDNNAVSFPLWQERCSAVREMVFSGCMTVKPRRDGYYINNYPSAYDSEIQRLSGQYKPLNPLFIPDHLKEAFHLDLMRLETEWAELFVWDLASVSQGGGVVLVQHFICSIGEAISMFKQGATAEAVQAQFEEINEIKNKILTYSRSEPND